MPRRSVVCRDTQLWHANEGIHRFVQQLRQSVEARGKITRALLATPKRSCDQREEPAAHGCDDVQWVPRRGANLRAFKADSRKCGECEVTIGETQVTISDDGKGMTDRAHVEQFFETFAAFVTVVDGDFENGEDVILDREATEDRHLLRQIADAEAGAAVHRQPGDVAAVDGAVAHKPAPAFWLPIVEWLRVGTPRAMIEPAQAATIRQLKDKLGIADEKFAAALSASFSVESAERLTTQQAGQLIDRLTAKLNAAGVTGGAA